MCGENFEQDDKEQEDKREKNGHKTLKLPENPAVLATELSMSLTVILYCIYISVQNVVFFVITLHKFVTTDPVLTDDDESDEEKRARRDNGDDEEDHELIHGNSGVNTALSSVDDLGSSRDKSRQPISTKSHSLLRMDNSDDEEDLGVVPVNSTLWVAFSSVFLGNATTGYRQPQKSSSEQSMNSTFEI